MVYSNERDTRSAVQPSASRLPEPNGPPSIHARVEVSTGDPASAPSLGPLAGVGAEAAQPRTVSVLWFMRVTPTTESSTQRKGVCHEMHLSGCTLQPFPRTLIVCWPARQRRKKMSRGRMRPWMTKKRANGTPSPHRCVGTNR
eukprot:scaffold7488_cov444-Prasinococcus_capsulatus_cf.AAC.6